MRGCHNLNTLSFECLNWSACVASESWGELPVPPAEVIARGTRGVFEFVRGVFEFVRAMLLGGFCIRDEVFTHECVHIDLSRRSLNDSELLPLFKSFRDGNLMKLKGMKLVTLFAFKMKKLLPNLTHVLQAGNQIGDRGAEMIGEGLKVNSSLRELRLVRHFHHHFV